MPIAYEISIGSRSFASSGSVARARQPLVSIESEVGMGGSPGRCLLRTGTIAWTALRTGDPLRVQLDAGEGGETVFTGEVEHVVQRVDGLLVRAHDGLARLARTEVERAYEEVSAGFIANDLIEQAGAEAGAVEDGPTFPSYVVPRGPRALRHVQRLAELVGAELGTDGTGKIHFRRPGAGAPAHRLVWGEDILEMHIAQRAAAIDSFAIWGEGAAGTLGPERSHWLPTDSSGVSGRAAVQAGAPGQASAVVPGSTGALVRTVVDGAVRSAETASDLATARARLLALRPLVGHVVVLGRPAVHPGQWIELANLPAGDTGPRSQRARVLRVVHVLAMDRGLLTRLEL